MSYKGKYKIKNLKKYRGDPTKITYRSLWEKKFMNYCEGNPMVIEWSSEEIVVPYKSPIDKRIHRYFPDFSKSSIEFPEVFLKLLIFSNKRGIFPEFPDFPDSV